MTKPTMIDLAFLTRRFQIPTPDHIAVPAIADAVRKLLEVRAALDAQDKECQELDAKVTELRNRGAGHLTESLLADPFQQVDAPNEELEAAERAARDAWTTRAGLDGAAGLAMNAYVAAVDEHRATWQKSLAGKVTTGLTRITTAVRVLEDARDELAATLDVAEGLRQGAYTLKYNGPGNYAIPLSQAIDAAAQALAAATEQLEAIRAGEQAVT
jgi:hypothetical protein